MSVSYIERRADKPDVPKLNQACFSQLPYRNEQLPHSITYVARVDDTLSPDQAACWAAFWARVCPEVTFSVHPFDKATYAYCPPASRVSYNPKDDPKHVVVYEVVTKGLNRARVLLYLTAARYVDEYAELVGRWCEMAMTDPRPDDQTLFARMQELHAEWGEGIHTKDYPYGFGGHGLMQFAHRTKPGTAPYGNTFGPVTIETFKHHLTETHRSLVLNHFTMDADPASRATTVGLVPLAAAPVIVGAAGVAAPPRPAIVPAIAPVIAPRPAVDFIKAARVPVPRAIKPAIQPKRAARRVNQRVSP